MTDQEYVSVPGPLLALPLRATVACGIAEDEKMSPLKLGFAKVSALLELAPALATTPDPVLRMWIVLVALSDVETLLPKN
jgi:hypothetical protein